jgi:excisionase family DNA binding protein
MRKNPSTPSEILAIDLRTAAEKLDVSIPFLRLEISRGRLRPTRLGHKILIRTEELRRYLDAGTAHGGAASAEAR